MALHRPNSEDQSKLHAEVNQLVNQRFQLTTLAITLFGVVGAWILPKATPTSGTALGGFTFGACALLLILLLLVFGFSKLLTAMLRVISGYFIVTEASGWERDWVAYQGEGPHLGYTRPQAIVFLVLGLLTLVLPYAIASLYSLTLEPRSGAILLWSVWGAYMTAVVVLGVLNLGIRDRTAVRKWEAIERRRSNTPLQPTGGGSPAAEQLIAGCLGAIVGGLVGFEVGATVGGNFMMDFQFVGARGYEATGPIGALAGVMVGAALATLAARALRREHGAMS